MRVRELIFLDSRQDAEEYVRRSGRANRAVPGGTLFIAMTPGVYVYLKGQGYAVESTETYFNNQSHENALLKSDEIISWFRSSLNIKGFSSVVRRAYNDLFIFVTRFAIHRCIWTIEVVTNAIERHAPDVIGAPAGGKRKVNSFYLESEEESLGGLARIIAGQSGVVFKALRIKRSRSLFHPGQITGSLRFIAKKFNFDFLEKQMIKENKLRGDRPVFFTTQFYNLGKLRDKFQARFPGKRLYILRGPIVSPWRPCGPWSRLFFARISSGISAQQEGFRALRMAISGQERMFKHRGVEFSAVINEKISDNIEEYMLGQMVWGYRLERFFKRVAPALVISNGNRSDDDFIAELCRAMNIPDVLISHGSHVIPKSRPEAIEWGEHGMMLARGPFSHLALQTPPTEHYFEAFPAKARLIKTGPLIWGMLVDRERASKLFGSVAGGKFELKQTKVVVHAGTPKPARSMRFFVYETPDEYIKALRDLAGAVERISGAILIIKFRPSAEISVDDIKALIPFSEKVILSVEYPFLDVLGMADLLVSFSSTTIEEALQNRVPVLLYGGEGRYQHLGGFPVRSADPVPKAAVYHCASADTLEYGIKNILDLEINGQNTDDSRLFDQYIYTEKAREPLEKLILP